MEYDINSAESIYEFSLNLYDKTLNEAVVLPPEVVNAKSKGDLGSLVEKYFFKHVPPNNHEPDFAVAGLELKTTGLKKDKKGEFVAKERLVLTMIDFNTIVNQDWETSSYLHKCRRMLILFYEYDKEKSSIDRKFVLKPIIFEIPAEDLQIFKRDWETIRSKVRAGKAHEISEGDTFYLGACRKGAGGEKESLRRQPFSEIRAPARALAIKQGYLTRLVQKNVNNSLSFLGESNSLEIATQKKFEKFLGMSVDEISDYFKVHKTSKNQKGFKRKLATLILSGNEEVVPELQKAGIHMKTVCLNAKNRARESMSFPTFDFLAITKMDWEDSSFFEKIESKFLFVVFKLGEDGIERLHKVAYWNMPYEDRNEARRVWEDTKRRVSIDASDLPRMTESRVAHVRPKAKDGSDKALTPQGTYHLKQCFWLNSSYISDVIEEL